MTTAQNNKTPYYFFVVVWGEQFVNYLLNYCIPSLLAPNNIPALEKRSNKFILCTTTDDWKIIKNSNSYSNLKSYIEPVFLEIDYPQNGTPSCVHMGKGHKLATELCFKDKAYGIALTPDLILSDGTIANVQRAADKGTNIVLCAAVRFEEKGVFDGLSNQGFTTSDNVLSVNGRTLVKIACSSLHSQTKVYEYGKLNFAPRSPSVFWSVPKDGGILLHTMSWCPLLLDYSVLKSHDTSCLDTWTMDGDYVYKNYANNHQVHICTDSDEMMLVSWAPEDYNPVSLLPSAFRLLLCFFNKFICFGYVQELYFNALYDPLKRNYLKKHVYFHAKPLDKNWKKYERAADSSVVKQYPRIGKTFHFIFKRFGKFIDYANIVSSAIMGDKIAIGRIWNRIKRQLTFNVKESHAPHK